MQQKSNYTVNSPVIKEIIKSLETIKYGQVQITVHNSKVVQIDRTEKTRFDEQPLPEMRR
ncbi:MAG: YezD family protein [bacterium]